MNDDARSMVPLDIAVFKCCKMELDRSILMKKLPKRRAVTLIDSLMEVVEDFKAQRIASRDIIKQDSVKTST